MEPSNRNELYLTLSFAIGYFIIALIGIIFKGTTTPIFWLGLTSLHIVATIVIILKHKMRMK